MKTGESKPRLKSPVDCQERHELARAVADATVQVTKLKAGSKEWKVASKCLRAAQKAYWGHVREHKCKDPGERLKAIGVQKA